MICARPHVMMNDSPLCPSLSSVALTGVRERAGPRLRESCPLRPWLPLGRGARTRNLHIDPTLSRVSVLCICINLQRSFKVVDSGLLKSSSLAATLGSPPGWRGTLPGWQSGRSEGNWGKQPTIRARLRLSTATWSRSNFSSWGVKISSRKGEPTQLLLITSRKRKKYFRKTNWPKNVNGWSSQN